MFIWLLALALVQDPEASPRSRPEQLLQAKSCKSAQHASLLGEAKLPVDRLVGLDDIPPCLSKILGRLQTSAHQLVGNADATAVLQIGIGRGFSQTGLLFSAAEDSQIHYIEDVSSLTDILTAEWTDYASPDGDLGWSGFVLVFDKGGTKVRLSTSAESPLDAYEATQKLEAEFFPNKQVAAQGDASDATR